jgi:PleD family two-component response regulator
MNAHQKMILSVDDMPEILSGVKAALKYHYKVFGVTSAVDAMTFLKNHKPDLFILDIDMPFIDGYDTASFIRKDENHAKTPIIFLTSNATRDHVIKAVESGGNDYIVKPINHSVLLKKVRKYLG